MTNIRREIAARLKFELNRRGLSPSQASKLINISSSVIKSYIDEKRDIKFDELSLICNSLGVNPVRFLFSETYPKTSLAFRNIRPEAQIISSQIEDVFLLVEEALPDIDVPQEQRSFESGYERNDVIQEASGFVSSFFS